jgi:CBS domain-containing protein
MLLEKTRERSRTNVFPLAFRLGAFPILDPDAELVHALDGFLARGGLNFKRVRALAVMRRRTAFGVCGYWNLIDALDARNLIPDEPVEEFVTPEDEMYVAVETDTLETVSDQMTFKDAAQLPIVNPDGVYQGTILRETVRNLLDKEFANLSDLPVSLFIENNQPTLKRGDSLRLAASYFCNDSGYPLLSILEDGSRRLVGTLTYVDILRAVKGVLEKR